MSEDDAAMGELLKTNSTRRQGLGLSGRGGIVPVFKSGCTKASTYRNLLERKTRIGPWLLHDTHDKVREIMRRGNVPAEELAAHESSIRRWGCSSVRLELTDSQYAALLKRGIGWPWNGYELVQMKHAGGYPPARLTGDIRLKR